MTKTICFFVLSIVLCFACKKSNNIEVGPESSGLKVKIKAISGWGEFANITIDQDKTEIKYVNTADNLPQVPKDKAYKTSEATMKQLLNYIETYKLMDTKIDECARCADGMDYIISIQCESRKNTVTIAAQRSDGKYSDLLDLINKL